MSAKRTVSLPPAVKRFAAWAGVATAAVAFLLQGYALLQVVRGKAAAEQETKDKLVTLSTLVDEVRTDVKSLAASVNEMKGEIGGQKITPAEARRLVGPVQRITP